MELSIRRLQAVPWDALEGIVETVLPPIQRVLAGAAAEREIDALLRANRTLDTRQRAAVVEAIFGVGLWRRRLAVHTASPDPRALLFALLRDLSGVEESQAAKLVALASSLPARVPALADHECRELCRLDLGDDVGLVAGRVLVPRAQQLSLSVNSAHSHLVSGE